MIDVICTSAKERLRAKLARIRSRNVALDPGLINEVAAIISEVRVRGDAALLDYAEKFDGRRLDLRSLRVAPDELNKSAARVDARVMAALRESIRRVRIFHEREREFSWTIDGPNSSYVGQRVTPIRRVGLYVPGGSASYPSSVVMNVVPAQIAGVEQIAVATPPGTIEENPAVAAALIELNITEVYAMGGAQAIAALAYGTETVKRVDKITGPGNRYVTAAKKLCFGAVGIDSLAGPSEVVILADDSALAAFVAADMLAQAEHSEDASAVLITTSQELALRILNQLAAQMTRLPRADLIARSLRDYGAIIVAKDWVEACSLVNEMAPEHLEIMTRDEEAIAAKVRNAGAIFLGPHTPEAVGDYLAGPNHVLPTGGTAKFSSALGVRDFVKRTSVVKFSAAEVERTAELIAALAECEGLDGHARSVLIRGLQNASNS